MSWMSLLLAAGTLAGFTPWDGGTIRSIRPGSPDLLAAAKTGYRTAPTFRALVGNIEGSDVVAFVAAGRCEPQAPACLRFLGHDQGIRVLRITVDTFGRRDTQIIALLAHELQHVNEIVAATDVTDERSFQALFRRIGHAHGGGYETARAQEVGRSVERELTRSDRQTSVRVSTTRFPRASRRAPRAIRVIRVIGGLE